MFEASVQEIIRGYVWEALFAGGLSVVCWVLLFPLRTFVNSIKDKWAGQTKFLADIQFELTSQRMNCLTTLQSQGKEQVELLKKTVEALDKLHESQSEMSGFLRGLHSSK